jgi:hypothetical protein
MHENVLAVYIYTRNMKTLVHTIGIGQGSSPVQINWRASSQFYLKGNVVFLHFCRQFYPTIKINWMLSDQFISIGEDPYA